MLNHVALLKPPLSQLNVELVSWYITKSCFGVVHNIELGGWGDSFLSTFNNFVTLAGISGMVSRVLSKPVQKLLRQLSHCPPPPHKQCWTDDTKVYCQVNFFFNIV
jgi:hypothetical protein